MRLSFSMVLALLLAGCVVRPDGEQAERDRAQRIGVVWQQAYEERERPDLWPDAPLDVLLAHAEVGNGDLEAAFFRWLAALEKVPQASTQPTTAMVGLEHRLDGGAALDRTGLMLMSDAMNNILWPGRLAAAGEAALAEARVAAAAFDRARLSLQTRVTERYLELALRDVEIAIAERLRAVLAVNVPSVTARVRAGAAPQTALLQAQVALDRVEAELGRLRSSRPGLLAALRAVVGAGPEFTELRAVLPEVAPLRQSEQAVVAAALAGNAELAMASAEVEARGRELAVAEWERVPGFSLRGVLMGDGVATLAGAFTLPWLRGTAIEGMVREAEAGLQAAEALRRQAGSDAVAMVLGDFAMLRAVEQEAAVLEGRLLPRLRQMADVARAAWAAGGGEFAAWADALAMGLDVEVMVARLRKEHGVARARLAEGVGGR